MRSAPALTFAMFVNGTALFAAGSIDLGNRVGGTPYDAHMGPMRSVYSKMSGGTPSMDNVRNNLRTAKRFRYYFDRAKPYVPAHPSETEAQRKGDCKAKSLWLADKMGDRKNRFVIGTMKTRDKLSHAWLLWNYRGEWLILDPTWESDVIKADKVVGQKWFARYSFDGSGAFRHPTYSTYIGN